MLKFMDLFNDEEEIELELADLEDMTWTEEGIMIQNVDGLFYLTKKVDRVLTDFEVVRKKYADQIVNEEEFKEIEDAHEVLTEFHGMSGTMIGCSWWTAYEDKEAEEEVEEFVFYTKTEQ